MCLESPPISVVKVIERLLYKLDSDGDGQAQEGQDEDQGQDLAVKQCPSSNPEPHARWPPEVTLDEFRCGYVTLPDLVGAFAVSEA